MVNKNVGAVDRAIRAVLGIALIVVFIITENDWRWAALVLGLVALATAITSTCALYSIFGVRTDKKSES